MITAAAIIYAVGFIATLAAFLRMFWGDRELLADETGWFAAAFLTACTIAWPVFWIVAVVIVWLDGDEE